MTDVYSSDLAFTHSVKAVQSQRGSRRHYESVEADGAWPTRITSELKKFIEEQRSVFLATASKYGQPTIQHRGGPAGFLKVLNESTLAFVDYVGNRQYITAGNLAENPKAHLFLIDYRDRLRVKLWGEGRVAPQSGKLMEQLMPVGYKARAEQIIYFEVKAWDRNCPQHIPVRFDAEEVAGMLRDREDKIRSLETEIARLKKEACGGISS